MDKIKKFWNDLKQKPGFISVLSSLLAIGCGIVFGLILLLFLKPADAFYGFANMITAAFRSAYEFGDVLYYMTPLIMTGLGVAFAYKTGLFNIGASGQYVIGTFLALFCALVLKLPWYVCLIAAMIGGALWGSIPGFFKAYRNVNEVITSIMFNWMGVFLVNLLIANSPKMLANYYGATVSNRTASLGSANPNAILPALGLNQIFGGNSGVNVGIIIAILIAIGMYVVLNKTTFGFELKACGSNKFASKYAGINEKRNIILSMVISGALCGIGGGLYFLSGTGEYVIEKVVPDAGFNGIPVALLASSNPIGVIFSAFFVAFIKVGGKAMQPEFSSEVINVIIAVIIYLSAFALLFKNLIHKWLNKKRLAEQDRYFKEHRTILDSTDGKLINEPLPEEVKSEVNEEITDANESNSKAPKEDNEEVK